jgi:hypothetical protein
MEIQLKNIPVLAPLKMSFDEFENRLNQWRPGSNPRAPSLKWVVEGDVVFVVPDLASILLEFDLVEKDEKKNVALRAAIKEKLECDLSNF